MTSIKKIKAKPIIGEVKKGEIYRYWIWKHEAVGTEIKKEKRLGVIISTDGLNKWDKRFVIIPLTSKKLGEVYRYEVRTLVDGKHGKALIDQIKTVDKKRLIEKLGQLTEKEMNVVSEKLLAIFDLWEYLKKRELA
ncbi:MAG: type II toxin-antitoxin system PemK/MazF family toxin [Candidatus Moeniiplasma glomeromycotorum]|nr:type II toxin-antitoxin system PemK/MazF family toxin [Candidatus Moeniiplasma glomeromycotorum]MCE8169703.1 type II toxin-antitoxin system PemK/MazF family toxin [Candidatus Moeniiplasma glomeromycotorum]